MWTWSAMIVRAHCIAFLQMSNRLFFSSLVEARWFTKPENRWR